MHVQYFSKRLGEEFCDMKSFPVKERYCSQCNVAYTTILSINFGAGFCRPGCYIKFNRKFMELVSER